MESRRLSKGEQKFTRVAIICVDFLQLPLIDILSHEIKPADLFNKISTCSKLANGRGLQPGQQKICFLKPPNKPDYNKFDVTLLYKLLRNLCSSLTPQQDWGKEPKAIDILIVHDIERLRLFRNEIAHAVSSEFTNDKFEQFLKKVETVIQRIQNFTSNLGCKTNYMQRLKNIKTIEFGYEDLEKYKFCLESIFRSDQPEILIKGDKEIEVLCGDTAFFELELKQADLSYWTVTWHKMTGTRIDQINTSTTRYSDSNDRQLVIHSVCKEDKGNYQAVLSEKVPNGKSAIQVVSNVIFLHTLGEPPFSPELIVTNGREDIFVQYKYEVPEKSPKVCKLEWTKDGVKLDLKNEKYSGGDLDDVCLTIKSPTTNDRGIYCCTVSNAVGSESQEVKLDVPNATILKETTVYYGSSTKLSADVSSCPPPDEVKWQRSRDGNSFNFVDIDEPEYFRSTNDIQSPLLRIPKATSDVQLYYRLYLRNKLGENISNTIYLNITGSAPNIMVSHDVCFQNNSVKLIGKVYLFSGMLPAIQDVFWTKDGEKVDIQGSGGKYSEVAVDDPSLIIYNINHHDIGSYQLTAINAVGSTKSDVITLGKPQINLEKTERKKDGSYWFTMTIKAIPEPTNIQWSMKENNEKAFELLNINDEEYKGSTDAFPHPVLVVKSSKYEKYKFQIEVKNFTGNSEFMIQGEKYLKFQKSDHNIHDKSAIENSTIPNIRSEREVDEKEPCQPCFSEIRQKEETQICKTCDDLDLLCETCDKHHTEQKPFKDHKLSKDIGDCQKRSSDIQWSNHTEKAKIEGMDFSIPGKPAVMTICSDSVLLHWTESVHDIDYYQIRFKRKNGNDKWKFVATDSKQNEVSIHGLTANTAYIFQVRAVFEDQEGRYGPQSDDVITSESLATKLLKNSILVKNGNPTIYRLLAQELESSRNSSAKTRKLEFGTPLQETPEKTILLVGATGSGKTTLVNGAVNYATGVTFDDPFRFTIVQLEEGAMSQTEWITIYKISPQKGSRLRYTLNIIDTPGFGDNSVKGGDQVIIDQISQLFSSEGDKGVLFIDAVCFVVKAIDVRITASQKYFFNSIMSLFGKDIESNICILITFVDGGSPQVLASLSKANLPTESYFEFNNSALFAGNKNLASSSLSPMFWEMCCNSFQNFFDKLNEFPTRSLSQTKDILQEREQLKTVINCILSQVKSGLSKISELRCQIKIYKKYKDEIENHKNFEYEVEETRQVKVDLKPGQYATNCLVCLYTCHENCTLADDDDKHLCSVMENGYCTACTMKCSWTAHKSLPFTFEYRTEKVKKSFKEMKQKYDQALGTTMLQRNFIESLSCEVDKISKSVQMRIVELKHCKSRLEEIQLRPDPQLTVEYLEQMIESEEMNKQQGYQRRIQMFSEFKRMAQIDKDFEKFEEFFNSTKQEIASIASDN